MCDLRMAMMPFTSPVASINIAMYPSTNCTYVKFVRPSGKSAARVPSVYQLPAWRDGPKVLGIMRRVMRIALRYSTARMVH